MGLWGFGRWHRVEVADASAKAAPGYNSVGDYPVDAGVLSETLVELGLQIVGEVRGPMRLWDFSRRLGRRLGMPPLPLADLSDAVKATLSRIDDPRLRILAPDMQGVGYVYDATDPESHPVRASR
jgi:hypothetical protein